MSSHHIVRDDQEPALIIANGAACSDELLGQLLEWSPLVVVLDSAMVRVMEMDIKVDVLLGDFDADFEPEKYQTEKYVLSKNKGTGSPNNPYNPDEEFTIVNNGESEGDSSLGITLYMSGSGGN